MSFHLLSLCFHFFVTIRFYEFAVLLPHIAFWSSQYNWEPVPSFGAKCGGVPPPTFFKTFLFETVSLPRKRFFGALPKCLRSSVQNFRKTKYCKLKMQLFPQEGLTKPVMLGDQFAVVLRKTHVIF
jgi:hypothetical protein